MLARVEGEAGWRLSCFASFAARGTVTVEAEAIAVPLDASTASRPGPGGLGVGEVTRGRQPDKCRDDHRRHPRSQPYLNYEWQNSGISA